MEIKYDKDADAIYIKLRDGEFDKNKVVEKDLIIDMDKKGNILGIEILSASKKIPSKSLNEVSFKSLPPISA